MLAYIPYMDPMGLGTGILKKDGHSYGVVKRFDIWKES